MADEMHELVTIGVDGDRALCKCSAWHPINADGKMDVSRNLSEEEEEERLYQPPPDHRYASF